MADHTISLSTAQETLYQKWLVKTAQTDVEVMGKLKESLAAQVVQNVNELGRAKFEALPIADKIAFLG